MAQPYTITFPVIRFISYKSSQITVYATVYFQQQFRIFLENLSGLKVEGFLMEEGEDSD